MSNSALRPDPELGMLPLFGPSAHLSVSASTPHRHFQDMQHEKAPTPPGFGGQSGGIPDPVRRATLHRWLHVPMQQCSMVSSLSALDLGVSPDTSFPPPVLVFAAFAALTVLAPGLNRYVTCRCSLFFEAPLERKQMVDATKL